MIKALYTILGMTGFALLLSIRIEPLLTSFWRLSDEHF